MGKKLKLVITGTVDGQELMQWVENFRPDIPEERETALRNFRERIEQLGGDAQSVITREDVLVDNDSK